MVFILIVRSVTHENEEPSSSEITSRARLISKYMAIEGRYGNSVYYMTFELEDSSRLLFQVPITEYSMILEMETGALTYKVLSSGNEFISFKRD